MVTNIIGQTVVGVTAASARFMGLYGLGLTAGTTNAANGNRVTMPVAGTLKNFSVSMDTVSGGGLTRTFVVHKNGADTGVTITIPDGQLTGSDLVNTVAFSANDNISIKTTASGATANTGVMRWTIGADCAANVSMLMGGTAGNLSSTLTTYTAVQSYDSNTTAATSSEQIIPTAGTIKNAYVVLNGVPGTGASYTFTLVKNGTPTSLIVVISDAATGGSDLVGGDAVSVVAGDKVYWQVVPLVTPTARACFIGVEFDPTTDGESIQMFGGATNMVNSAVRYQGIASYNAAFLATEPGRSALTQAAVWKSLYVYVPTATGAAKTWQFQTDIATVAGNPSVTIDNSSTSGNDTANTATSNLGDTISMKVTPSGTPAASIVEWGIVNYINPNTATRGNLMMMGV